MGCALRTVVIADFDGTITEKSVGLGLLIKYGRGDFWQVEEQFCRGEKTLKQAVGEQFSMLEATREELRSFVAQTVRLRHYFPEFLGWCRHNGIPFVIASEGLDVVVDAALRAHHLGTVSMYADEAVFADAKPEKPRIAVRTVASPGPMTGVRPSSLLVGVKFPHASPDPESCDFCGVCKTSLVRKYQDEGYRVIYVGDGSTDFCAGPMADVLYARDDLLHYCREKGIPARPWRDWRDVRASIEDEIILAAKARRP